VQPPSLPNLANAQLIFRGASDDRARPSLAVPLSAAASALVVARQRRAENRLEELDLEPPVAHESADVIVLEAESGGDRLVIPRRIARTPSSWGAIGETTQRQRRGAGTSSTLESIEDSGETHGPGTGSVPPSAATSGTAPARDSAGRGAGASFPAAWQRGRPAGVEFTASSAAPVRSASVAPAALSDGGAGGGAGRRSCRGGREQRRRPPANACDFKDKLVLGNVDPGHKLTSESAQCTSNRWHIR